MPKLVLALAIAGAALVLGACTGFDHVILNLDEQGCRLRDVVGTPCPVVAVAQQPKRYCYRNLANVECYDAEVRFGPEPGWQRSPPPDLVR